MNPVEAEGITALTLYLALSVLMLLLVWLIGMKNGRGLAPLAKTLSYWKEAAVITAIYFLASAIGSGVSGISVLWSAGLFCQALVGVSIAREAGKHLPFPVAGDLQHGRKPATSILKMLGIALAAAVLVMAGSMIAALAGSLAGESNASEGIASLLPRSGFRAFFALLAGAGIIEGVTYRLVVLSLAMRFVKGRLPAALIATAVFLVYHFTPMNMMAGVYWQMPVTQAVNVLLGATVIGFVYAKWGFETSVLAHTFSDFIPLLAVLYVMPK